MKDLNSYIDEALIKTHMSPSQSDNIYLIYTTGELYNRLAENDNFEYVYGDHNVNLYMTDDEGIEEIEYLIDDVYDKIRACVVYRMPKRFKTKEEFIDAWNNGKCSFNEISKCLIHKYK